MLIKHSIRFASIKWLMMVVVYMSLCGCLGGSIAQQVVRSILIQVADKATANALDAKERNDKLIAQKKPLKDSPPDAYKIAFLNAGFENADHKTAGVENANHENTGQVTAPITLEPLPMALSVEELPLQSLQENMLIEVEVWSMLVGEEKLNILESARIKGSLNLPPKAEWQQWQLAVGGAQNSQATGKNAANHSIDTQQAVTFLIPPVMGKMHSGVKAMVELSSVGDLNMGRYTLN